MHLSILILAVVAFFFASAFITALSKLVCNPPDKPPT